MQSIQIRKGPSGRITGLNQLLADMVRQDVLNVLLEFSLSAAGHHGFADSTDFDLVYESRRYPPKAVLGLAAARVIGRPLTSDEFTGGEKSVCFTVLKRLGFEIKPKISITGASAGKPYPFIVGKDYQRKDVMLVVGVDDSGGGNWYTGYVSRGPDWFIFCNIGVSGRTGHDYQNGFQGDDLVWFGKNRSSISQHSIQSLLRPDGNTYVFYRDDNQKPFTFAGIGSPVSVTDETPVKVLWSLRPVTHDASTYNTLQDIDRVRADTSIPETVRQQLVQARIGQGLFRSNVLKIESACRVTGVTNPDFLIASHVKPWKVSDNDERLAGSNGLMLAPHIDRLFDKGFITFANDGSILISQKLPESVLNAWSITVPVIQKPLSPAQTVFMQYHREHVFLV
jgi:Domain of unknown function (DUF3427)/HNH endonuclease